MGRHPKPFTKADINQALLLEFAFDYPS